MDFVSSVIPKAAHIAPASGSVVLSGFGSGSGWHSGGIATASTLLLILLGFLSFFDHRAFAFSDCFSEFFCDNLVSSNARLFSMRSLSSDILPNLTSEFITFLALFLVHPKRLEMRSRSYSGGWPVEAVSVTIVIKAPRSSKESSLVPDSQSSPKRRM